MDGHLTPVFYCVLLFFIWFLYNKRNTSSFIDNTYTLVSSPLPRRDLPVLNARPLGAGGGNSISSWGI